MISLFLLLQLRCTSKVALERHVGIPTAKDDDDADADADVKNYLVLGGFIILLTYSNFHIVFYKLHYINKHARILLQISHITRQHA
jgi:hypothetical protein